MQLYPEAPDPFSAELIASNHQVHVQLESGYQTLGTHLAIFCFVSLAMANSDAHVKVRRFTDLSTC